MTEDTIFVSKEIILHYAQIKTFELDEDKIIVINKQINILLEYPEEYVQNNSRNWLKIQQDIAFVKKSLKGSGPPPQEIVKSLLERKKSLENDKHLGLGDAAANQVNHSTAATCPQIRVWLESYGITFPDQRNSASSTGFWLSPNTPEEE